ncbi:unnamed protein product [Medioppia subpectinata]|uniref:GYF domain-containing protein n=1 Tax=Medioppia subpectinata TaxID=1979941 RepID=A0A7R9PWR9_9ACAR|nr:unnamed protein product [Medioppia subpectinata]CAG2104047.1 unnamed protein product [Medioppia subpectinata]
MMATDMKFGPEWLRALSDGGPNSSQTGTGGPPAPSAPQKYKLSEYRYGREEMLALFNHNLKPPESLAEFPHLFVEKMQLPLALINMSEEESRLWNRVNSDVVLRLMGKGGNGPERGDRPVPERGGVSMRAGRGGSVPERGRGRGRGGYYHRGNYEESGDSPPERRDFLGGRSKVFERNHSLNEENINPREKRGYERSFSRGGGVGTAVEDLRKNNSRSSSVENWRTGGRGEDREGWRTARGSAENNWNNSVTNRSALWRKDYNRHPESWEEIEDPDRRGSLPEWSLEDPSDVDAKVGTFDASGAFREDTNEDEETKYDNELDDENRDDSRETLKSDDISKRSNQNSKSLNNEFQKESKIAKQNQNIDKSIKNDENSDSKESTLNVLKQLQQKSAQSSAQSSSQTPTNSSNKLFKTNASLNSNSNSHNINKNSSEEDGFGQFAHLEKEAENMVAQWTADDEPKDNKQRLAAVVAAEEQPSGGVVVLPIQHDDAFKWFYRDPQNEIQGPFTPHEMYDWFTAGYFAMDLLVRRGCDEYFSQLGELLKLWGCIPFILVHGQHPPLRAQSSTPSHPSHPAPQPSHHPMASSHIRHPQPSNPTPHPSQAPQPQQPVLTNQQSVDMQSQLRQLLAQLKKQEGFSELSQQQQQEVLVQRYVLLEQQRQQSLQSSIPTRTANEDNVSQQMAALDRLSGLRIDGNRSQQQMVNNNNSHQNVSSIWDLNTGALSVSAIEEMQRKEQELKELEELKERRKAFEEEQNRKKLEQQQEEMQRHMNEERERKFQEIQKKLEDERMRAQELLRKQEEENRRREEEERLRMEEEERRTAEEQKRRHEELLRLEEYARRQALQEEEKRRQMEMEKERQRQQIHEMERERAMEMERLRQLQQQQQNQQQLQQEAMIKLQQQREERQRKGWGQTAPEPNQKPQNSLSLDDIQRLQEEKEREERQRKALQQKHMQALFAAQQQQQNKQSSGWAATTFQPTAAPLKTLADIQREEAEKVAKQRVIENKKQQTQVTNNVPNAGIWNNANNQLFGQSIPPPIQTSSAKSNNNNAVSIGFWEPESRKVQTNRANESALHSMQTNSKGNTNNTQFQTKISARDKKDEESVLRLFEHQRRQKNDEFTQWCIEALSKYQSSVDIPTFIAFLKDVESPFEINDYVRSYLGEGKDVKEFAKQFIERRSYFRNRAKKEASEELMWGPAPAITPSANKLSQPNACAVNSVTNNSDIDMSGFIQSSKKKKKGKRVIDNSILGFTVQADPDRMAGEIEQIDD